MKSEAITVDQYLAELPSGRREAISAVRKVIIENLPKGYREVMNWGMICYEVPLDVYPETYNGKPLMYAGLASQKNHMAVYLSSIYTDEAARKKFEADYKAAGKRYDAGKSCVRFRKLDDLPLAVIAQAVRSMEMEEYIAAVKKVIADRKSKKKA